MTNRTPAVPRSLWLCVARACAAPCAIRARGMKKLHDTLLLSGYPIDLCTKLEYFLRLEGLPTP